MIVMKCYEGGNLYDFIGEVGKEIFWRDIIDILWGVVRGLERIHSEGKLHGNLHGGNLLVEGENVSIDAWISDVGLYGPSDRNQIYGVLPYTAPEILRGTKPSMASDI